MPNRLIAVPRNTHVGVNGVDAYLIVDCPSEVAEKVERALVKAGVPTNLKKGAPIDGRGGLDTLTLIDSQSPGTAQRILDRFEHELPAWFLDS
jgi:hypothetical protein